ncbi:MAG: hypothetical protein K8R87_03470 [Verrucomicrobia bacterium]|nr:hypothetical protein [Verrucomicrobiota bacterium]
MLQGWVDLGDVKWNGETKRLSGTANVIGGEPFKIVVANNGQKPTSVSAEAATAKFEAVGSGDLTAIVLERPTTGTVTWQMHCQ